MMLEDEVEKQISIFIFLTSAAQHLDHIQDEGLPMRILQ